VTAPDPGLMQQSAAASSTASSPVHSDFSLVGAACGQRGFQGRRGGRRLIRWRPCNDRIAALFSRRSVGADWLLNGRHTAIGGPQANEIPRASDTSSWHTSRLCVVIPAFNEEHTVGDVVSSVYQAVPGACVIVVNDGSTDETAERATAAGATVISLCFNLGVGGAVQSGYLYALRHHLEICVQIDGDGQHDPADVPRLVEPLLAGLADMVVGSRWLGRESIKRLGVAASA